MKHVISAVILAAIVGCAAVIPTKDRTISLPTKEYRQDFAEEKEIITVFRQACLDKGVFFIVHRGQREKYICIPGEGVGDG
jgi:hypothetical protein